MIAQRLTMVQLIKNKEGGTITHYVCISGDYKIVKLSAVELAETLKAGQVIVTNLAFEKGEIASTNGALSNYPTYSADKGTMGKSTVIIDRVETKGVLTGYTVYSANFGVATLTVAETVSIYSTCGIANGKVRHTQQGDTISAIGGTYPLREIELPKVSTSGLPTQVIFIGEAIKGNSSIKYGGVMVGGQSAMALAELRKKIEINCKDLIKQVKALSGVDVSKSFSIVTTGDAGFYGVFPYDIVLRLTDSKFIKGESLVGSDSVMLSVVDYAGDGVESYLELDGSKKPSNLTKGTKDGDAALKALTRKVQEDFPSGK